MRRVMGDEDAHHRRDMDVKAVVEQVVLPAQRGSDIAVGAADLDLLDDQRCLPADHLHRLGQVLPNEGRAHDVMSIDEPL